MIGQGHPGVIRQFCDVAEGRCAPVPLVDPRRSLINLDGREAPASEGRQCRMESANAREEVHEGEWWSTGHGHSFAESGSGIKQRGGVSSN